MVPASQSGEMLAMFLHFSLIALMVMTLAVTNQRSRAGIQFEVRSVSDPIRPHRTNALKMDIEVPEELKELNLAAYGVREWDLSAYKYVDLIIIRERVAEQMSGFDYEKKYYCKFLKEEMESIPFGTKEKIVGSFTWNGNKYNVKLIFEGSGNSFSKRSGGVGKQRAKIVIAGSA